jgi:uncharacterized membrane protein
VYQLLLYIHIVCAVIWVGGAFYAQLLALRVIRSDDPDETPRLARHIEAIGSRVFVPAAVVLLIAGAVMTAQRFSFMDAWIVAAIALWLLSAVAASVYLAPRAKRAAELFETEGPGSEAGLGLVRRLFLVSRLELASFALVIALMVFKPQL